MPPDCAYLHSTEKWDRNRPWHLGISQIDGKERCQVPKSPIHGWGWSKTRYEILVFSSSSERGFGEGVWFSCLLGPVIPKILHLHVGHNEAHRQLTHALTCCVPHNWRSFSYSSSCFRDRCRAGGCHGSSPRLGQLWTHLTIDDGHWLLQRGKRLSR